MAFSSPEAGREYRERNRERIQEYRKEYRAKNRDRLKEKDKRRREAEGPRLRALAAERRARPGYRDACREYQQQRRVKTADYYQKTQERIRRWIENNPERHRLLRLKARFAKGLGIPYRFISDEVVEAKLLQVAVLREIRART